MLALDTEDNSHGTVWIINFYDGMTHTTFEGKDCQLRAQNFLVANSGQTVWACNMEYDLINVYGEWLAQACTLQYVRSGLLRATTRDARILFLDTLRHWPLSVRAMGDYLGLEKLEQDFRSVAYCRRDTEIVWRFVSTMLDRYDDLQLKHKATLPSMALQLWKRCYGTKLPELPDSVVRWLRHGYYGGRVEVYRFGKIVGETHHYDVNSLFPFVMRTKAYPNLTTWRITATPDFSNEGMAHVSLSLPKTTYPCLPIRTDHGILYPYGALEGTWCYPEIRRALDDGAVISRVFSACEFSRTVHPFNGYVDLCYGERRRSSTDLDRVFWKLMMNSLYGKFGQLDGLEMIFNDRSFTINNRAAHANVIWSAYVTSYARLTLLDWLRQCSEVYYTDTDSIFTPDVLPTDADLGSLKSEGLYQRCEFIGNKIYTYDGITSDSLGPTRESKAKGVPKGVASDFIRTGRAIYSKPARFRESRRSFMKANVWYEVEKTLTAQYQKRRILKNGTTAPWSLSAFRRRFPHTRVGLPDMPEHQPFGGERGEEP